MQDMKLVELVNKAREEAHRDTQNLRKEFRQEMLGLRGELSRFNASIVRKLVWGVVLLGLALGGKDLLSLVLQ